MGLSRWGAILVQVLRLLKVLGAGNSEASDQMSDILAQVPLWLCAKKGQGPCPGKAQLQRRLGGQGSAAKSAKPSHLKASLPNDARFDLKEGAILIGAT